MVIDTDVVITGAGPAGACAALALKAYSSLQVVVLEQADFSQPRVGEHVSASLFALLDYLQLPKTLFPSDSFLPCYGDTSYWGSVLPSVRHSMFHHEQTVQLDRELFDLTLLEQLQQRGAVLLPRTHSQVSVAAAADGPWRWQLACQHPQQGDFTVRARFLLDASGRNSALARQLGGRSQRLDQLLGAGLFFQCTDSTDQAQDQLIEATEHGWWYGARLPAGQYVATFFADADLISQLRLNQGKHWWQWLQQSQQLKKRLLGAKPLTAHPWLRNAASQYTQPPTLSHYLAVGDAACAFDPISSMGLGFAVSSACQAARLVQLSLTESLTGPGTEALCQSYQQDLQTQFVAYQRLRQQMYQQERRWSGAPFWQRRQTMSPLFG